MQSAETLYFHGPALKKRFARHLNEALGARRINVDQQRWLQRLLHDPGSEVMPGPRVDRLVSDTGLELGSELTAAWVISDPMHPEAALFLHTLVFGLERFENRTLLDTALTKRFLAGRNAELEVEQVQGDLFMQRSNTMVEQQARHLDALSVQLGRLPSLPATIGRKLQAEIASRVQEEVDVLQHPLQIISETEHEGRHVVGTLALAEAAFADHGGTTALTRQFLGARGEVLSEAAALPWQLALAASGKDLGMQFDTLLDEYWSSPCAGGLTARQFFTGALADTFREALLQARAREALSELEWRRLRDAVLLDGANTSLAWQVSVILGGPVAIKLAGVFVVEPIGTELPGIYLYAPRHGIRRFTSQQALEAYFNSEQGFVEILHVTSLNEHSALQVQSTVQVRLDLIEDALFTRQLDSIIAAQKRSLVYVLDLPAIEHKRAAVRVDDALYIRHLLDPRLASLHDNTRWAGTPGGFQARWAADRAMIDDDHLVRLDIPALWSSGSWADQLRGMDLFVERQGQLYSGITGCMRDALNSYLAVLGDPFVDARSLWVQLHGQDNVRLVSLALERVSGQAPGALPAGARVLSGDTAHSIQQAQVVPVELLEHILGQVCMDFPARYDRHLRRFFSGPLRRLDTQLPVPALGHQLLASALHLDLSMGMRVVEQNPQGLALFQQALERPLASLRVALGDDAVEVNRVELAFDPQQPRVPLHDTLILRRPAGGGMHVLWSLCTGLSAHDSLQALADKLVHDLQSPVFRAAWMNLLETADRERLQQYLQTCSGPLQLTLSLQPLQGHFIQALQQADTDRQCREVARSLQQLTAWKIPVDELCNVQRAHECDMASRHLIDRIGMTQQLMLADALLPQWARQATISQLFELRSIVQRWYVACHSHQDFLFDIPEPRQYARSRLLVRLQADFPGLNLSPDRIKVTLTHYTAAPVAPGEVPQGLPAAVNRVNATLTDYAIERFSASQEGIISITGSNGAGLANGLTPDYLERLVRELDIPAHYRQLLKDKFSSADPDYTTRLKYYAEQMPPLELLRMYAMRITHMLSEEGYRFMEGILEMSDGLGRLPVRGHDIIISPLQLQAGTDMDVNKALGMFVVAPRAPQPGPWLLYVQFNADFLLQEFASEADLLHAVRTDKALQALVLERLDPFGRRLYDNGGFMEPHVPFSTESALDMPWHTPGPVTLAVTPIVGNALHTLLESAGQLLQGCFEQLSVTNGEFDRARSTFLWTLVGEQSLALLPGRLGALVGVWQSQGLLHASALDVVQEQWGKAASELLAGLGVLISTRRAKALEESEPEPTLLEKDSAINDRQRMPDFPSFGWGNNHMTPQLWARLRPYQVHEVALSALAKDPLLNLYLNPGNGKRYVPLAGAVYEVAEDENGWYILSEDNNGPRITLDVNQQWQLDLKGGLRGGGAIVTRMRTSLIDGAVEGSLLVEARGMAEIRQKFRNRAHNIATAHDQARQYLETCLDNLGHRTAEGRRHPQVTAVLGEFFGVSQPDSHLFEAVDQVVNSLYRELMSPSLSPFDSERFIVGTNRGRRESTLAFTFPNEPQKRIYLTEKFFADPLCRLKHQVIRRGSFNLGAHFRAAILLHELSHLYCDTEDIAYVESHMPFLDLIDDNSAYRRSIRDEIAMHQAGLSHRTPADQLFRLHQDDGTWRELGKGDGKALRKVLDITGTKSLGPARTVFYADARKRVDVMLANADTVAWLVTVLGREKKVP